MVVEKHQRPGHTVIRQGDTYMVVEVFQDSGVCFSLGNGQDAPVRFTAPGVSDLIEAIKAVRRTRKVVKDIPFALVHGIVPVARGSLNRCQDDPKRFRIVWEDADWRRLGWAYILTDGQLSDILRQAEWHVGHSKAR